MTFEEYLQNEIHPQLFPQILDDDLPDHFDNWLGDIDGEDWLEWGELYGKSQFLGGMDRAISQLKS